jgi:hypothetical protein
MLQQDSCQRSRSVPNDDGRKGDADNDDDEDRLRAEQFEDERVFLEGYRLGMGRRHFHRR